MIEKVDKKQERSKGSKKPGAKREISSHFFAELPILTMSQGQLWQKVERITQYTLHTQEIYPVTNSFFDSSSFVSPFSALGVKSPI